MREEYGKRSRFTCWLEGYLGSFALGASSYIGAPAMDNTLIVGYLGVVLCSAGVGLLGRSVGGDVGSKRNLESRNDSHGVRDVTL